MIPFKNYIKADLYKFFKSKISISHFLIPIVGVALMIVYFAISSWDTLEKVSAYLQVISMIFPLIISIVVTIAYEQEEGVKGFQYFLSTPRKRYIPHISKLSLLIIFGILSTAISILGFGAIYNIVVKMHIDLIFYVKEVLIIFISNIPLYMIQYLIVFWLGKGPSIGMGIIGTLVSALMVTGIGDGLWFVLPWGYSIRLSSYFFQYSINDNLSLASQGEINIAIISISIYIIIGLVSLLIFSNYWNGKKENS